MKAPIQKPHGPLQQVGINSDISGTDDIISVTVEKTTKRKCVIKVPRRIRKWFRKDKRCT